MGRYVSDAFEIFYSDYSFQENIFIDHNRDRIETRLSIQGGLGPRLSPACMIIELDGGSQHCG